MVYGIGSMAITVKVEMKWEMVMIERRAPPDLLLESSMSVSVKSPMNVSILKLYYPTRKWHEPTSKVDQTKKRERLTSRFLICFASGESAPMTLKLDFELVSLLSGFRGATEGPPACAGGPLLAMVDERMFRMCEGGSQQSRYPRNAQDSMSRLPGKW